MRLINSFLIVILLVACNIKAEENNFLMKYQYPFSALKTPKVFVYQSVDSINLKAYICQHYFNKNGTNFFLKYTLDQSRRDSSIFELVDGYPILRECYKIMPDRENKIEKIYQGKIEDWLNTDYKHKSKIQYSDAFGKDIVTEIVNTSIYDTTVVFDLNGENIDCIRYKDNFEFRTKHKHFSNINRSFEIEGESLYGSNLGIIYYSTKNKRSGKTSAWRLERIIDLQDYKKEKRVPTNRNSAPG